MNPPKTTRRIPVEFTEAQHCLLTRILDNALESRNLYGKKDRNLLYNIVSKFAKAKTRYDDPSLCKFHRQACRFCGTT